MLEARETSRHPEVGQYWAQLSPLTLSQVTQTADDGSTFSFRQWPPRGVDDYVLFIGPFRPEQFRYLWFSAKVQRFRFPSSEKVRTGDVWLARPPNAANSGLIFIGPDSNDGFLHLLSDWHFNNHGLGIVFTEAFLFQQGPGDLALSEERSRFLSLLTAYADKPRPSSWDHVLKCSP